MSYEVREVQLTSTIDERLPRRLSSLIIFCVCPIHCLDVRRNGTRRTRSTSYTSTNNSTCTFFDFDFDFWTLTFLTSSLLFSKIQQKAKRLLLSSNKSSVIQ